MLEANFLKSAVEPEDYPPGDRPEVAMVGRSNAGKSSLLNCMIGPKAIAKVSQNPGKTRLINFFDVGSHYRLVDLPGYGFAKRSNDEKVLWRDMIFKYFESRANLRGIILVCDVRRHWEDDEDMVLDLCTSKSVKIACALTKIDKLNNSELAKQRKVWLQGSTLGESDIHFVSNLKKTGVKELEDHVFKNWVKQK